MTEQADRGESPLVSEEPAEAAGVLWPEAAAVGGGDPRAVLEDLERQVHELRGEGFSEAAALAERLAGIERNLIHLSARLEQDDFGAARIDGGAVLADLHIWRKLCDKLGEGAAGRETERLIHDYLEKAALAWSKLVRPLLAEPRPDACFEALFQTATLQLEAQRQSVEDPAGWETLTETRLLLRQALQESLENEPLTDETRRRWATELADQSDLVLTAIDDLTPRHAAAQLAVIADDLQWHLAQVETARGKARRRLRRKLARLRAEQQERMLQHRLEHRFGRPFVAWSERLVLVLILVVVGLMAVESAVTLSPTTQFWFNVIDLAACCVFLSEFFVKWMFVAVSVRWFSRHFLIDLVPSVPIGFLTTTLTTAAGADAIRLGRLGRLLRLGRLARYVRMLRPLLRLLRGFGLLSRGLDRLARRYGPVLNRNVILYPTRAEMARTRTTNPVLRSHVRQLQLEVRDLWKRLMTSGDETGRPQVAGRRLAVFETALDRALADGRDTPALQSVETREIPAETLLNRMQSVTPQDLEAQFGEALVEQLARGVRVFGRPPLRWFPIISRCVPHVTDEMTDAEVVAAGTRRLGAVLQRYHDAWFWVSDLYGTVTPSQFVDRVGTMLVNSSIRPAYRLVMFGGFFLLIKAILSLTRLEALEPVQAFLNRFVAPTVMLLGGICFVIVGVGWWLKRLAREATEFCERAVQAQFLSLTEVIRSRHLARDAELLYERVLRPEWELEDRGQGSEVRGQEAEVRGQEAGGRRQEAGGRRDEAADNRRRLIELASSPPPLNFANIGATRPGSCDDTLSVDQERVARFAGRVRESLVDARLSRDGTAASESLERTVLLYLDWLDGAMFTDSDTRVTSQLLGNPSVRQALMLSARISHRQVRALQTLDLVRQKSLFGGPYLWFNFVSRSIAHSVACLLVDYNRHAIPLDELPLVGPAERGRYDDWLGQTESEAQQGIQQQPETDETSYVTTAFTALHFLDFDPHRDREIEQRFGPDVLRRLQHDRSLLIRRIFGTYPMSHLPKEQRVVNLYSLYESWLAGGRALLMPVWLLGAGLKCLAGLLKWIGSAVQEVRRPDRRSVLRKTAEADFRTAARKIGRIRGPVVYASLRVRLLLDPEYLGIPLPGNRLSELEGADVDGDLEFLRPAPAMLEEVEQERQRAQADMRRLETLIDGGLLNRLARRLGLSEGAFDTRLHLRAAAVAYLADYRGVRSHLSAGTLLEEVYETAAAQPRLPARRDVRLVPLRRTFRQYWSLYGFGGERERTAAWRATAHNVWGAADALRTWGKLGDGAAAEGERLLGEMLLHPGRINEQLLSVRTLQTLAMLDVLNYREHVYHLGRYADMGDDADQLLEWNRQR